MQRPLAAVHPALCCVAVAVAWSGVARAQVVPGQVAPRQVPPGPVAATPVEFVLEDQFKNRHETARLRGHVVVLVYAERHGAEAAVDLGRRLHVRFHPTAATAPPEQWATQPVVAPAGWPAGVPAPDVHVVPIACVPEVPLALQAVARSRLRKESPHLSVWLDFENDLKRTFGMVDGAPNTAVVDTGGIPRGVVPGVPDERRFDELVAFIDGLRLTARPEPRVATFPPPAAVVPAR